MKQSLIHVLNDVNKYWNDIEQALITAYVTDFWIFWDDGQVRTYLGLAMHKDYKRLCCHQIGPMHSLVNMEAIRKEPEEFVPVLEAKLHIRLTLADHLLNFESRLLEHQERIQKQAIETYQKLHKYLRQREKASEPS